MVVVQGGASGVERYRLLETLRQYGQERLAESGEADAIRDVVRMQEDVGLRAATDGEFRRTSWHMDFIYQLGGVSKTPAVHIASPAKASPAANRQRGESR